MVDQLGNVMSNWRQPLQPLEWNGSNIEFQGEVWNRCRKVGIARSLPVPIDTALDLGYPS